MLKNLNKRFNLEEEKSENQIFEIFNPQNFFEKSAKAKLLKLEPFAWSYWIRNHEKCLRY